MLKDDDVDGDAMQFVRLACSYAQNSHVTLVT